MGSTKPERSISSAIALPQWMKTKMNDRYDIDEPFSPPSHDDNFFYIRYPKSSVALPTNQNPIHEQEQRNYRPISELLEKDPGLSRHTANCRQFIPQANMSKDLPGISLTKAKKSQGTDDGFTGEAAACGKSVVHVAQQMIAGKYVGGGAGGLVVGGEPHDLAHRRGSKSLPASPLATPDSSPAVARKPNRFFTGAFTDKPSQEAKYPGGWILSSLMGQREPMGAGASIAEEEAPRGDEDVPAARDRLAVVAGLRRNKSATGIGALFRDEPAADGAKVVRPKPSELREMNFWTPTSM